MGGRSHSSSEESAEKVRRPSPLRRGRPFSSDLSDSRFLALFPPVRPLFPIAGIAFFPLSSLDRIVAVVVVVEFLLLWAPSLLLSSSFYPRRRLPTHPPLTPLPFPPLLLLPIPPPTLSGLLPPLPLPSLSPSSTCSGWVGRRAGGSPPSPCWFKQENGKWRRRRRQRRSWEEEREDPRVGRRKRRRRRGGGRRPA